MPCTKLARGSSQLRNGFRGAAPSASRKQLPRTCVDVCVDTADVVEHHRTEHVGFARGIRQPIGSGCSNERLRT